MNPRIKKIGLFGFSANPPQCGHLEVARLLLKNRLVDEVWLVPCFKHPFGKKLAPSRHRWQMAKLLEEKGIKTSDVEFFRKGKSYTVDTMEILKEKFPNYRFFWVVGSDIVKSGNYKKWKDWQKLSSSTNFLVVNRAGFKLGKAPSGFILVKGRVSDISSTEIRRRVQASLPITGLVPSEIKEYIEKHGLTF